MKTKIFSLILLALIFFMNRSFAEDNSYLNPIELKGILPPPSGPNRVPSPYPPLEAYWQNSFVSIQFYRDLGNIQITVSDETGMIVYQTDTVSAYGIVEYINTNSFGVGYYTLTLTNANGMCLYGEFVL